MTYSYEDVQEVRLKAQCCFPLITYNIIQAGKTGNPCIETLKLQAKMLEYYIQALKRYRPVGYEYTLNDEVYTTQEEDDICLSEEDLQWVIEGVRGICQCSSCLDTQDLITDI